MEKIYVISGAGMAGRGDCAARVGAVVQSVCLGSVWTFRFVGDQGHSLYPIVRSAYESDVKTGVEQLVGENGMAQERFDPYGMVRVRGELWQAAAEPTEQPIEPNMK
jgi:membrane-bound ClpP family serine protease